MAHSSNTAHNTNSSDELNHFRRFNGELADITRAIANASTIREAIEGYKRALPFIQQPFSKELQVIQNMLQATDGTREMISVSERADDITMARALNTYYMAITGEEFSMDKSNADSTKQILLHILNQINPIVAMRERELEIQAAEEEVPRYHAQKSPSIVSTKELRENHIAALQNSGYTIPLDMTAVFDNQTGEPKIDAHDWIYSTSSIVELEEKFHFAYGQEMQRYSIPKEIEVIIDKNSKFTDAERSRLKAFFKFVHLTPNGLRSLINGERNEEFLTLVRNNPFNETDYNWQGKNFKKFLVGFHEICRDLELPILLVSPYSGGCKTAGAQKHISNYCASMLGVPPFALRPDFFSKAFKVTLPTSGFPAIFEAAYLAGKGNNETRQDGPFDFQISSSGSIHTYIPADRLASLLEEEGKTEVANRLRNFSEAQKAAYRRFKEQNPRLHEEVCRSSLSIERPTHIEVTKDGRMGFLFEDEIASRKGMKFLKLQFGAKTIRTSPTSVHIEMSAGDGDFGSRLTKDKKECAPVFQNKNSEENVLNKLLKLRPGQFQYSFVPNSFIISGLCPLQQMNLKTGQIQPIPAVNAAAAPIIAPVAHVTRTSSIVASAASSASVAAPAISKTIPAKTIPAQTAAAQTSTPQNSASQTVPSPQNSPSGLEALIQEYRKLSSAQRMELLWFYAEHKTSNFVFSERGEVRDHLNSFAKTEPEEALALLNRFKANILPQQPEASAAALSSNSASQPAQAAAPRLNLTSLTGHLNEIYNSNLSFFLYESLQQQFPEHRTLLAEGRIQEVIERNQNLKDPIESAVKSFKGIYM